MIEFNPIKILAYAMIEQQEYGQLCPETMERLNKIVSEAV